jgi:hypothetical protein
VENGPLLFATRPVHVEAAGAFGGCWGGEENEDKECAGDGGMGGHSGGWGCGLELVGEGQVERRVGFVVCSGKDSDTVTDLIKTGEDE